MYWVSSESSCTVYEGRFGGQHNAQSVSRQYPDQAAWHKQQSRDVSLLNAPAQYIKAGLVDIMMQATCLDTVLTNLLVQNLCCMDADVSCSRACLMLVLVAAVHVEC